MSEEPSQALVALRPPRFYCTTHCATNQIVGVGGRTYCLTCLDELARVYLPEVIKLDPSDFLVGDPR